MQNVKKCALITTLLVSAVAVSAVVPGITAFADDAAASIDTTIYPESYTYELSFEDLHDYSIEDDNYIFADGNKVIVLQGDDMNYWEMSSDVTNVDVQDGVFYCMYEKGSYVLSGSSWSAADEDHDFTPRSSSYMETDEELGYSLVYAGENTYRTNQYGLIIDYVFEDTVASETKTGYSMLRYYNDTVYAVCDNEVFAFDGIDETPIVFTYIDFQDADEIAIGNSLEKMQEIDITNLCKVTLKSETSAGDPVYMSSISLEDSDIRGEYFKVSDTFQVTDSSTLKAGDDALLLCTVGNAYIVSYQRDVYIMAQSGADVSVIPLEDSDIPAATAIETFSAYYTPFIKECNSYFDLITAQSYDIVGELTQETYPFLAYDFYVISTDETDDNGETITINGYVPSGAMSEYTYPPETPSTTSEDEPSYDNYIRTVVLVIVLVALILALAGYLIFVATGSKRRKSSSLNQDGDDLDLSDDDSSGTDSKDKD